METPTAYWPGPTLAMLSLPRHWAAVAPEAVPAMVQELLRQGALRVDVHGLNPGGATTFLASNRSLPQTEK